MLRHGRSGLCSLRIVWRFPVIFRFSLRRVRLVRHALMRNAVVWYALMRHADAVWRADVWLCAALWLSSVELWLGRVRIRLSPVFALPRQ
jgi:hypothetical protein